MTATYRKATIEDSFAVFQVFLKTITDYGARMNVMAITGGSDPEMLGSLWEKRKDKFEFLAKISSEFWIAESDGEVIGYARTIEHDGLQELTEFFVLPTAQSGGIGAELLARAFPKTGSPYRTIIATLDERATIRYLKAGVYARFPIKYFSRKAEKVDVSSDLTFEPLRLDLHLDDLNRIDKQIISHTRPHIHHWLVTDRDGFICRRDGAIAGYGYTGMYNGPFAVLDDNDFPAVLAHAESIAAEKGEDFGGEVGLVNGKAIQYFLERKYQMDAFTVLFMSNQPFGKFENYLFSSPVFFM